MAETQTITGVHNPTVPSPGADDRFEDDCIDLLCKQENARALLSEAKTKRRDLDSLDFAKMMISQFLDFAESHFDDVQFRDIGQRLYVVSQRTRDYEKMLVAKWFKILRRMVGMAVPTEEEICRAHKQLRSDYVELYNEFMANCAKRFPRDSAIQDQFLKSVATFLREFDERW
jgi:hypothetical protein